MPREDATALAAAIDALLDDVELARGAGASARARSSLPRFGLATMLDRMEAVFRRALADGGAAR